MLPSGSVTIAANERYAFVDVFTTDDGDAEALESVTVTIDPDPSPTPAYGIDVPSAAINGTSPSRSG